MSQIGTARTSAATAIFRFNVLPVRSVRIVELSRMRSFVILALCTLAACSDAGAEEEKKYRMVERENASYSDKYRARELCKQGKLVADAYLNDKNEEQYKTWKLRSDIQCNLADL